MGLYTNKTVIVTGAANGLGRQIATDYVKEGAVVIAVDINEKGLRELKDTTSAFEGEVYEYVGDIALQQTNEAMIDYAVEITGKLDILVNNAGVPGRCEPVGELTNELWNKVISINLQAPMFAMRKAVNVMLEQETGGNIINIASDSGLIAGRSGVAYTTAKHGLIGLSKNTAYMYLKNKIRCNAIAPGAIQTDILQAFPDDSKFGAERIYAGMGKDAGFEVGQPEDVSNLVLFLTSDKAKHITGVVYNIDGGLLSY